MYLAQVTFSHILKDNGIEIVEYYNIIVSKNAKNSQIAENLKISRLGEGGRGKGG